MKYKYTLFGNREFLFCNNILMNNLQSPLKKCNFASKSPLKKCKFWAKSPLKKCQIFDLYYVTKKDRTDAWGLEKSRHEQHQRFTKKGGELGNGAQCEVMLTAEPFGDF